ncbi:MAG: cytochrome P450 [Ilumatobacteraceae bacterium]|nr:cytochrome P450 [Acidimicrobiaceae bacterium]
MTAPALAAGIDHLCDDAIERPHQYFGALRDEQPVAWSQRHRTWVVTGHPECLAAFKDPALSTDRLDAFTARQTPDRAAALAAAVDLLRGWMLFHDPPEHTRLRAPFHRRFTPKAVADLEADVAAECDRLLDAMEAGPRRTDLVTAFAHELPAAVIARLFGVPDELRHWLAEWSARFGVVVFGATRRPDYEAVARAAGEEFHQHLGALLRLRREHPRDDLVSMLAASDELSELEVIGACSMLLFAGHDTTASQIGTATLSLLEHPDALHAFRTGTADRDTAVEELLRFDGAATAMMRIVARPTKLGGQTLEPGQAVWLNQLAANRDPRVFHDPDHLRLDRSPNPHLAFGHGTHFCLGAALARLELRVALPRLMARFPALAIDGPAEWKPDISDRSAARIPVSLA